MPSVSRDKVLFSSKRAGPNDPKPSGPPSPVEFSEPTPPLTECDRVLGLYLRVWNQLEHALNEVFGAFLGAHNTAAHIITSSGISQQTLREITLALAGQRLKHNDLEALAKLMERAKRASTKRNRLMHGAWSLSIQINKPGPNTAVWDRYYSPADPRLHARMHGPRASQKVRDDYVFPVARIAQISEETHRLAKEIRAFLAKVSIAPFDDPLPLELSAPQP